MAYETGTATGPADLVAKLQTFAQTLGWTVSAQTTASTSFYPGVAVAGRVFSKGSLVFGIGWGASDLYVVGATGTDASVWNNQPGRSGTSGGAGGSRSNDSAGPYLAYHFFAGTSPDYIHVVIERSAGIFKNLVFGSLIKAGTYTGGAYFGATYWIPSTTYINVANSSYHNTIFDSVSPVSEANIWRLRADIDGKTNNWMEGGGSSGTNRASGGVRGASGNQTIIKSFLERSPAAFNSLTPLIPLPIMGSRTNGNWSMLGYVPDFRVVQIDNFTPGQVLTIGGQEWMVFPVIQKSTTAGSSPGTTVNSHNHGFACRRFT